MKREIKEIEEEKNDLLKEKSAIFISLTDIINYNEELKIEVQNLKDKYESFFCKTPNIFSSPITLHVPQDL